MHPTPRLPTRSPQGLFTAQVKTEARRTPGALMPPGGTSRPLPGTPAPPSSTSPRPAVDTQPLTLPAAPAPPVPQFHLLRHAPVLGQNPPSVLTHRLSLVTQSVQSSTVSDLKSPHVPSLQNAPRIQASSLLPLPYLVSSHHLPPGLVQSPALGPHALTLIPAVASRGESGPAFLCPQPFGAPTSFRVKAQVIPRHTRSCSHPLPALIFSRCPPHSLCSSHRGLLFAPPSHQAGYYPRTFALAVAAVQTALLPDIRTSHSLTSFRSLVLSSVPCHLKTPPKLGCLSASFSARALVQKVQNGTGAQ